MSGGSFRGELTGMHTQTRRDAKGHRRGLPCQAVVSGAHGGRAQCRPMPAARRPWVAGGRGSRGPLATESPCDGERTSEKLIITTAVLFA